MGMTPEGKVKRKIRGLLDCYEGIWYYMPVPTGYGKRTIDFLGCFRGTFFGIEAKEEGKKPTQLQAHTLRQIKHAGGRTFVIDGETPDKMSPLYEWLETINGNVPYVRQPSAPEDHRSVPA